MTHWFAPRIAHRLPKRMRTWVILRNWYWQVDEIEEGRRRADALAHDLGWDLPQEGTRRPPEGDRRAQHDQGGEE